MNGTPTPSVAPQGAPSDEPVFALAGEWPDLIPALWRKDEHELRVIYDALVAYRLTRHELESAMGELTVHEAERLAFFAAWRQALEQK